MSVVLTSGCATLPFSTHLGGGFIPHILPQRVEIVEVPLFPQDNYQCGPAALATALTFAGAARTPQDLVDQVYLPQRQGSLQTEMLAATRRTGLLAYLLQSELVAILQEVAAGHPVVVLQNLRFDWFPQWHYAVVFGYDLDTDKLLLRSGTQSRLDVGVGNFNSSWMKAGKWAFVAMKPGELPATASEGPYREAASSLERLAPEGARVAYQVASAKWPSNLVARIGLGNIAYGLRDLSEAERQFGRAINEHPESADAWNNPAQVLHELHRGPEGLRAAQRAVAIGGSRLQSYQATLKTIDSSLGR